MDIFVRLAAAIWIGAIDVMNITTTKELKSKSLVDANEINV